jgi:amino acid transporter
MSNGKKLDLVRGLGKWSSAAIVVGTMVGTGIFLKPAEMAADAGSLFIVLAAWVVGGVLSLFGALAFAELGAALPEAGGEYAYLRRAFGPVWGFLFGWMHSIVGRPASTSSIAAGLLRFCAFLVPAMAAPIFVTRISLPFSQAPYTFAFTWAQPWAVAALAVFAFINFLGVRAGGRLQVILTAVKISSVAAIIVIAFAFVRPGGAGFHPFFPSGYGAFTFTGFFGALAAALWVYDGWEDLNLVGSEVEDPQRNIPRSLILGRSLLHRCFIYCIQHGRALGAFLRDRRGIEARGFGPRRPSLRAQRGPVGDAGDDHFRSRHAERFRFCRARACRTRWRATASFFAVPPKSIRGFERPAARFYSNSLSPASLR